MSEPRRWLDGDELTADERHVLGADLGRSPPPGAKRMVRTAVAASLATAKAAAAAAGAGGAIVKGGATWSALAFLKAVGVGFAVAGVVGGVLVEYPRRDTAGTPSAAPHQASHHVDEITAHEAHEPSPANTPVSTPPAAATAENKAYRATPVHPSSEPPSTPSLPRASEGQRVALARRLLRENRAAAAREVLSALEQDEPHGLLAQEREALLLQALSALGDCRHATARANDFVARYPTSPHLTSVRAAARNCDAR